MSKNYVVGFPRIGEQRELKKVLESFWAKKSSFSEVQKVACELKKRHWNYQKDAGIDFISSNDFSLYDNMLDTSIMLNAVPLRFSDLKNEELYFAAPDQIYLFNQNDEWKTFGEYCFIKPLKDRDLTGVIKFNNNQLKEKGLKQGDIIGYPPGREWRFLIDEELLYCMKSKNISVKYENQGNEIEYNPRWAKGGGRIDKGC